MDGEQAGARAVRNCDTIETQQTRPSSDRDWWVLLLCLAQKVAYRSREAFGDPRYAFSRNPAPVPENQADACAASVAYS